MAAIGTRRERVLLELETNFPREAAVAAAAVAALNEEINHLGGNKTRGNLKAVGKDIEDTGRRADRAAPSIDKFSGRVNLLAKSIAAIGPSVIPISALAVPAITGLASSFGFAAIAGGTMIGAFQGVGDALKALNTAALEPTAAHLQAAREAMATISPEARKFVKELQHLQPELLHLRDIAAAGMFPGMTEGLDQLLSALPKVQRIVGAVAGELGNLSADAGKSLGGARWADFFDFLAAEAPKALSDMAHGVGNVAHAMAELWMAFAPLNNSFSSWLVDSTAKLDKWASGLAETQGFQEFVGYIQQNGPQVAATMGAIGDAVLQIVEAAAPIGGPVLKVIEGLANAIAKIADSDIGTPLFGMVAALSALNLAMSAGRSIQGKFAAQQASLSGSFQKQRSSLRDLTTQWRAYQQVSAFQGGKTTSFGGATTLAQAEKFKGTLRSTALEAGKAAALVGAFTVATTGMGDKLGVSNTVMLAMAGSVIPGWGTAIGAATGAVIDLTSANDDLTSATKAASVAMGSDNIDAMAAAYERLNAQLEASRENKTLLDKLPDTGVIGAIASGLKKGAQSDAATQLDKLGKAVEGNVGGVDSLLHGLGVLPIKMTLAGNASAAAAEALRASRDAARTTAQSFVGLGDSVSDSKVSLTGWIRDMSRMATALRQFTANSLVAANKGLRQGLIKELQKAGPEGALRMKQLADGTEKQVHRANKAWLSQRAAIKSYTNAVGGVPGSKSTKVAAPGAAQAKAQIKAMRDEIQRLKDKSVHMDEKGAAAARARIAALRDAINSLHDKSVTVSYHRRNFGGPNVVADGGTIMNYGGEVPGQREPYGDKVHAFLAPGEEVITNRHGEADQFRADRAAGRIPHYAGGGTVLRLANGGTAGDRDGHNSLRDRIKRLNKAIDLATKSIDKERTARDDLVSRRNDLASTVGGAFTTDLFGQQPANLSFMNAAQKQAALTGGVFSTLKSDIANANTFKATLSGLKKRGLDGQALASLAASGDVQRAQAFANLSQKDLGTYETLFNQRAAAAASVGSTAGNAVYGAAIAAQNKHLLAEIAELKGLRHDLKVAQKKPKTIHVHDKSGNPKQTAKEVSRRQAMAG